MSTSAIAASSSNIVSSVIGVVRPLTRQPSGDGDSNSGSAPVQGGRLFTALFDALTQFVAEHQAAPAATTGAASPASTATVTTAAAGTGTASSAATAPAATPSTATSTPSPAATSSTNSSGSSGTPASSLGADLQAFLHDLFSALRQSGGAREHTGHGSGRARDDWRAAATPAVPVSNTQQSASTGASTGSSAALNAAPPAATNTSTTSAAATPAAVSTPATPPAAPVATSSASSTAAYGRFGIVAELNALIKDLSNSQVVSATSTAAGAPANLSSSALANLNSAFTKLITDLGGTTSTASTAATGAASSNASSSSAANSSPQSGTASLQAFLSSLLQDLQSGAGNSLSPLGNGVNVSA